MQELRTEPRQRRSQQSIDAILDAAERLIHEQGQVGFTANELAAAAGMSIGRVYYWFPDIPAVVTALVERSAAPHGARCSATSAPHQYGVTTPLLLQRAIGAMCVYVDENPAAVALCLTGGADGPGQVHVRSARRVRHRAGRATACPASPTPRSRSWPAPRSASRSACSTATPWPARPRPLIQQELVYVLSAYLYARFPPPERLHVDVDPSAACSRRARRGATSPSRPACGRRSRPTSPRS